MTLCEFIDMPNEYGEDLLYLDDVLGFPINPMQSAILGFDLQAEGGILVLSETCAVFCVVVE